MICTAFEASQLVEAASNKLVDIRAELQLGIKYDTKVAAHRRWLTSSPAK